MGVNITDGVNHVASVACVHERSKSKAAGLGTWLPSRTEICYWIFGSGVSSVLRQDTYNAAHVHLVEFLKSRLKVGDAICIGGLGGIRYRTIADIKLQAARALLLARDFVTDKNMSRKERGDPSLDSECEPGDPNDVVEVCDPHPSST